MPKSRRRPAAARKLAASRRHHAGSGHAVLGHAGYDGSTHDDGEYELTEAPWVAWQEVSAHPDASPEMLAVLEHTPFRLAGAEGTAGNAVTLAAMHAESAVSGGMAEFISSQQQLADWGYLRWDRRTRTAMLCVPEDAAGSLAGN